MKISVEIKAGPLNKELVTKQDIQKNIDAIQRAIDGKPQCSDFVPLSSTKSILVGIQKQLPDL